MSSPSNPASNSSNFETLFNGALEKYTKQSGEDLRGHPLVSRIDGCNGPDSVLDIFQEQAWAFDEFKKGDTKLLKWLRPVVNVLHALSINEILRHGAGHVSPATFLITHSRCLDSLCTRCFRPRKRFSPPSGSFYLCVSPSSPPHALSNLGLADGQIREGEL